MKTEKALFLLAVVGLLMKLLYWPFSNLVLVIALGALSILYFPLGFYFLSAQTIKKYLGISIFAGFLLYPAPIGILFKLMYWPGYGPLLILGSISCLVLLAIVLTQRQKAPLEDRPYFRNLMYRTILLGSISIFLFSTTTATLVKLQYRDDPEMARLKIQYLQNPGNEEYKRLYNNYQLKKDSMEMRSR